MSKALKFLFIPGFFFLALFFASSSALAACSTNTNIDFVARDPGGAFIPNVRVDVYKQEIDANGHAKPTTRFTSATTDSNLGVAHLSFRNSLESDTYVFKVQAISKDNASFWYYNNVLTCGQSVTIEKTLSGISFSLHDADGNPLTNTSFNVYSQLYDSSGNPLKERREMLTTLNTGYSGQAKVYLPQGSIRSIDNSLSDHYALELSRPSAKFYFYNISVKDGRLTNLDYYLSSLSIHLQDVSGANFPAGTSVEVYKQDIDVNNQPIKGVKIGSFTIGENGLGNFEVPAGIYALAVKGKTGQYQYFYNIEAEDGRATEYTLTPDRTWTPSDGSCQTNLNLTLNIRSYSKNAVAGLKFEVYEQNTDANGLPVPGTRVGGGTFDNSGTYVLTFRPDPRKTYALKIWDKRADVGEFWYFDATRFVCGYDRVVTKTLPALRIVMRDAKGVLKKNFSFSLYMQDYDADNNPVIEDGNLIANLKTDNTGSARVYVAPYNTYRYQTGVYAITSKDANNNNATSYNIRMYPERDTVFNYAFTGLAGELRNASRVLLPNKEVRFYEVVGTGSDRALGNLLTKTTTDKTGRFRFEYPAGTYAIAVLDDFNHESITWNVVLKAGKTNSIKIVNSLNKVSVADAQGEVIPKDASIKIFSLTSDDGFNYYKAGEVANVKLSASKSAAISLAPGYYLASYFDKSGREFGRYFKSANGVVTTTKVTTSVTNRITANRVFKIK